ncbi:hypothetical protein IP69_14185 [Bosea sp. AAP35]|uniref:type II toxin-antitoxin system RelE/ParE family toxin n=1 Tax=Bosea sp. AAP35 TaxID=1523417 RepID=UPI0006B94304|nr:type II toxin-antitoxin system mRNA interferase toxin, RelE/StbE family [Bosea sp. AAP35]KPF66907.1 hypothetical protein IP69_14185 [Bosea sp. AAP35]
MRLVWTRRALTDIDGIFAYVAAENPDSAERLTREIEARVQTLADHPEAGRPGRVEGTREFVVTGTPYILPYRVREGRVEILAVLHAARGWPNRF